MRIASHIATALSAATGRSDRPNGRLLVGACGYWGVLQLDESLRARLETETGITGAGSPLRR